MIGPCRLFVAGDCVQNRTYCEVDVFGAQAYLGNPLAVVLDAQGLDAQQMQRFARWTNLSETSFVLAPTVPGADYQVRIFTPARELTFAGHPTLGSCHAWLEQGGTPRDATRIVQQCALGLVGLRREGARLAFRAPPLERTPVQEASLAPVLRALGLARAAVLAAQWLHSGQPWLALLADSAQTVLALEPNHEALKTQSLVGVIGPWREGQPEGGSERCEFEVRAFASSVGIEEDPVTGSLNAALAQWLIAEGHAPPQYVASQGARRQRAGRVYIESRKGEVWVGGACVTAVRGTVLL